MSNILYKIRNKIRGRRTHTFCVGAAKTGTTSLAEIMSQALRSAHEPLVEKTNNLVINYLSGKIKDKEVASELVKRDTELFLEFESSHQLGYLAPIIATTFPESNFVITIREPEKWLKSRLNFHHEKKPKEWEEYRNFIWNRHKVDYHKCEQVLKDRGLFPLQTYLSQYVEQYQYVFDNISEDRLLVVRTEEIDTSLDVIAEFSNIPKAQLHAVRSNQLVLEDNIIDFLPNEFVSEQVDKVRSAIKKYL